DPGASAVLTSPLSLEEESDTNYRAPNLLQRVVSLLKNVRPGSDLTRFQAKNKHLTIPSISKYRRRSQYPLPPLFNIPKSQLQCYGESVYCTGQDMLSRCANGTSSVDRFTSVVAWSISTLRPLTFGVAPYNPILGETHHASRGALNVLVEQVSHHPPVSALHATNEEDNIETTWCHYAVPKFYGTSIETVVHGQKQLKLLTKDETYVINSPKLVIRFFPIPSVDWLGNVTIRCEESGLEAELCYKGSSFLGRRANYRSIRGKITSLSSSKPIYEISGHWDRTVTVKDTTNGKLTVIYNAKEVLSGLKTPTVKDSQGIWPSESAVVWGEVSRGILSKWWDKAREAKKAIGEKERKFCQRERVKRRNLEYLTARKLDGSAHQTRSGCHLRQLLSLYNLTLVYHPSKNLSAGLLAGEHHAGLEPFGLANKRVRTDLASNRALLALLVSFLAIEAKSIGETSARKAEYGSRK
ncbi:hypothetical protein RJ640_003487, partial [Escallonia rubra]